MTASTKKRTHVPAGEFDATAAAASAQSAIDALTGQAASQVVHMVSPDRLHPHPRNPRRALGDLEELQASIAANGILQPVTAVPHPDLPGEYRILLGHCRTQCARNLALPFVPVMVRDDLGEAAQLEAMLVENIQRSDLTVVEEGQGFQGLLDLGVKRTEIAQHTGRAVSTVGQRLKVASLPEVFHQPIVEHQLTLEEATDFADLRTTDEEAFSFAVSKLEAGFAPSAAVLVRAALAKTRIREKVAAAVEKWKARGWDLRVTVDSGSRDVPEGALKIVSWQGLQWKPADHEASGCPHGVVYANSSWMDNIEGWGEFYCLQPDTHADRLAEVERLEAEGRQARTPVESPGQRAAREAAEQMDADLAEAALARRRFLCSVFAGTSDEAHAAAQLLVAHALDVADDPDLRDEDCLVDTTIYDAAVEQPFNGVDALGRLALAVLSIVEQAVPTDAWLFGHLTNYDTCRPVRTYLQLLANLDHPLTKWEARLLEAITEALDGSAVAARADADDGTKAGA